MAGKVRTGQVVTLASAAMVLLFSFMDQTKSGDSDGLWSDFGLFTFPALFAGVALVVVALQAFGNVELSKDLLTLRVEQWLLLLALTGFLIMVGYWRAAANLSSLTGEEVAFAAPFWLGFLGSLSLLVGIGTDQRRPQGSVGGTPTSF